LQWNIDQQNTYGKKLIKKKLSFAVIYIISQVKLQHEHEWFIFLAQFKIACVQLFLAHTFNIFLSKFSGRLSLKTIRIRTVILMKRHNAKNKTCGVNQFRQLKRKFMKNENFIFIKTISKVNFVRDFNTTNRIKFSARFIQNHHKLSKHHSQKILSSLGLMDDFWVVLNKLTVLIT